MARRRQGRDWQERAFDEGEYQRRDRAGGVPPDLPNPLKVSTDLPRRPTWRWTAIGIAVLVVAILIRNGLNSRAPTLVTSCTTPAMALSTASTHQESVVRWSVTGPPRSVLVITIGVARLMRGAAPGQLHPVPDPGGRPATTQIAVRPGALSTKCVAHGEFSVGVPAGHYTVRLFRLSGSGAGVSGTVVASKPLTVSS